MTEHGRRMADQEITPLKRFFISVAQNVVTSVILLVVGGIATGIWFIYDSVTNTNRQISILTNPATGVLARIDDHEWRIRKIEYRVFPPKE